MRATLVRRSRLRPSRARVTSGRGRRASDPGDRLLFRDRARDGARGRPSGPSRLRDGPQPQRPGGAGGRRRTSPRSLSTSPIRPRSARPSGETLSRAGRIDALVNNAGYAQYGAVEEVAAEEWRAVFDVNFFGMLDVTRAVLPSMREAGGGHDRPDVFAGRAAERPVRLAVLRFQARRRSRGRRPARRDRALRHPGRARSSPVPSIRSSRTAPAPIVGPLISRPGPYRELLRERRTGDGRRLPPRAPASRARRARRRRCDRIAAAPRPLQGHLAGADAHPPEASSPRPLARPDDAVFPQAAGGPGLGPYAAHAGSEGPQLPRAHQGLDGRRRRRRPPSSSSAPAQLPFVFKHVAAMADTHWGLGATVGSVIATKGAVCPAAVGVDIGCGMAAVKTSPAASALETGSCRALRASIERGIPVGFHQRKDPHPQGCGVARGGGGGGPAGGGQRIRAEEGGASVRHTGRRQPLHRDLRRPGRCPGVGPPALRVPQHRQDHGRAPHLEGQGRDGEARRLPPRSGSRVLRDGHPRVRRLRAGPSVVPGFRPHEPGHHGRGRPQGPAPRASASSRPSRP